MMRTITRLTTSLIANFDWAVTQFENHEALVSAAIREIQHAGAKARVQLSRVRQDGEKMRSRLSDLRESDTLWEGRALSCAASDQARALECLKRRKRVKAEATELEVRLEHHARLERDLTNDLEAVDRRIEDLKRKRNTLRTRESTAEALSAMQSHDTGLITELDGVLDRWEIKVATYEREECPPETLQFEREFESEEENALLKLELETLQVEALSNAQTTK